MKWHVKGLDRTTGADRTETLEADDETSAAKLAGQRGLFIETITPAFHEKADVIPVIDANVLPRQARRPVWRISRSLVLLFGVLIVLLGVWGTDIYRRWQLTASNLLKEDVGVNFQMISDPAKMMDGTIQLRGDYLGSREGIIFYNDHDGVMTQAEMKFALDLDELPLFKKTLSKLTSRISLMSANPAVLQSERNLIEQFVANTMIFSFDNYGELSDWVGNSLKQIARDPQSVHRIQASDRRLYILYEDGYLVVGVKRL